MRKWKVGLPSGSSVSTWVEWNEEFGVMDQPRPATKSCWWVSISSVSHESVRSSICISSSAAWARFSHVDSISGASAANQRPPSQASYCTRSSVESDRPVLGALQSQAAVFSGMSRVFVFRCQSHLNQLTIQTISHVN